MIGTAQDSSLVDAPSSPATQPDLDPTPVAADSGPLLRLEPSRATDPRLRANPRFHVLRLRSPSPDFERNLSIYLPVAYAADPTRRFPVFYLHDGQNLFDGETSYLPGRTWQAHTTADALIAAGEVEPLIFVGINHAGVRRMPEYTPTPDAKFGGGGGDRYGHLLLDEIKPLIDSTWRTLPDAAHTGLGGSSLGGLISLYLALRHRDRFSRIAVISPSIWWDHRSILQRVREASPEPDLRIWLDMGTAEGIQHLHDTDQLYGILLDRGWCAGENLLYQRIPGGQHNEDAWAARFGDVLRFLFPSAARSTQSPSANPEPTSTSTS